jgi:hypothetical protein
MADLIAVVVEIKAERHRVVTDRRVLLLKELRESGIFFFDQLTAMGAPDNHPGSRRMLADCLEKVQ